MDMSSTLDTDIRRDNNEEGSTSWHPALRANTNSSNLEAKSEGNVEKLSHAHSDSALEETTLKRFNSKEGVHNLSSPEEISFGTAQANVAIGGIDAENSANQSLDRSLRDAAKNIQPAGEVIADNKTLEEPINEPAKIHDSLAEASENADGEGWEAFGADETTTSTVDFLQSEDAQEDPSMKEFREAHLIRSATFPDVPSLAMSLPTHHIPHSQVEEIIEDIEEEEKGGTDTLVSGLPHTERRELENTHDGAEQSFFEQMTESNRNQFFDDDEEEEARFEEGMPLFAHEEQGTEEKERTSVSKFEPDFGTTTDEHDDFSAELWAHGNGPEPPSLDRKTTIQVLDSIQYPPSYQEDHDSSSEDERPGSTDRLPGGGIGVPMSIVISHTLIDNMQKETAAAVEKSLAQTAKVDEISAMWQAALADDDFLDDEATGEQVKALDPSAFFEDDGEGFLEEEELGPVDPITSPPDIQPILDEHERPTGFNHTITPGVNSLPSNVAPQNRYAPSQERSLQNGDEHRPVPNAYAPNGLASRSTFLPSTLSRPQQDQALGAGRQPQSGVMTRSYTATAGGSSEGKSLYDLPFDVTRPKRRSDLKLQNVNDSVLTPPPRSSSITSPGGIGQPSPGATTPGSRGQTFLPKESKSSFFEDLPITSKSRPPPAGGRIGSYAPPSSTTTNAPPALRPKASSSSFFEELPNVTKTRSPSMLAQVPQQPSQIQLPSAGTSSPFGAQTSQMGVGIAHQPLTQQHVPASSTSQQYGLVPSQKMPLFSEPQNQPFPPIPLTSRKSSSSPYAPAPPTQGQPNSKIRYQSGPASVPLRPPSASHTAPFQPRTSSPLARSASSVQQYAPVSSINVPFNPDSASELSGRTRRPSLRSTQSSQYPPNSPSAHMAPGVALPTQRSSAHHPLYQTQMPTPEDHASFRPPWSRTQSPTSFTPQVNLLPTEMINNARSASVNDLAYVPTEPQALRATYAQPTMLYSKPQIVADNMLKPTDGRELDPLERWKGAPIFSFGFGGQGITCFPKRIPRFTMGQTTPMIKCTQGDMKIITMKSLLLDDRVITFPGPLKGKGKKKDLLEWLNKSIEQFQTLHIPLSTAISVEDARKRLNEKLVLWKLLRIMVENDGVIEGTGAVEAAIRDVLSPTLDAQNLTQISYDLEAPSPTIVRSSTFNQSRSAEDPEALEKLRQLLIRGSREEAVWSAVDQRSWGHAMLISSTLSRDIWGRVVHEFVQQEVKTYGPNTQSIAALYDIFGGNAEESIDQLVPPSARAGLQMVSKVAGMSQTTNALEGLDNWQDTLSLILSNRSADDHKAIAALGQLLANYGRIEAAHTCYLFTKSPSMFGGPDEPTAAIVLLGADHTNQPFDFSKDLDAILLTEIYEFATTVLAPSGQSAGLPHLQAYKLRHASVMAECGYRDEALRYCDALQSILKATTKMSPYYHNRLFGELDDFNSRLKQAPSQSSASWIARPSMEKVSGSVWSRFNQFVSGDDSEATANGSNKGLENSEYGPFAKMSGDTPVISRDPSPSNFNGSYANDTMDAPAQPHQVISRYAPPSTHTPSMPSSTPLPSYEPAVHPRQDFKASNLEPYRPSSIRKQPSYASMTSSSPDRARKSRFDTPPYMPAPTTPTFPADPAQMTASPPQMDTSPKSHNPYTPQSQTSSYAPAFESRYMSSTDQPAEHPYQPQIQQDNTYESTPTAQRNSMADHAFSPTTMPPSMPSYDAVAPGPTGYGYGSAPLEQLEDPQASATSIEPPIPSYGYEPPNTSYNPPEPDIVQESSSYGYEPPSLSYNPPDYSMDQANGEAISPVESRSKPRSFMDDDGEDDMVAKAEALKREQRAQKDREADEAFKRAAEDDAKRDADAKAGSAKGGWFGGWLGGGGKAKEKDAAPSSKPIKARLGEANSFEFDPVLKKWIDKKDPSSATTPSATPPPPKGPPSRVVSAGGGPPMSNTSRIGTPLNAEPGSFSARGTPPPPASGPASVDGTPPRSVGLPKTAHADPSIPSSLGVPGLSSSPGVQAGGPPSAPPSAPPSRPGTAAGPSANASSNNLGLDDLLGPPTAGGTRRAGGTMRRKGRGYVDVMAKGT
ncbi:vesicle coat component [Agyrium rufum]|nr:vesicle coat component [Agyrium rufum]